MPIAGYEVTSFIDQGDAWVNAVDPKEIIHIAHRECAWNYEDLREYGSGSDVTNLRKITILEAQEKGRICAYCEQPLTARQYFAFQWEYKEANDLASIPILDEYCWSRNHYGGWCCPECFHSREKKRITSRTPG